MEHDLELALMRLAWRLDGLDQWRTTVETRLGDLSTRLDGLSRLLDSMTKADEIADAVAQRVKQDRSFQFSLLQKALIGASGALGFAGMLHGLGAW